MRILSLPERSGGGSQEPAGKPPGGGGTRRFIMRPRVLVGIVLLLACAWLSDSAFAIGQAQYVETVPTPGGFPIVQGGAAAAIWVDPGDWPGVIRAVNDLQADIARVSGCQAAIHNDAGSLAGHAIIVGTIGRSRVIDDLARSGKIDTSRIAGKWESFFLQVVANPLPGAAAGLVIVGSDKRGTIYGVYDLSEQMGVSPWYWWADVPVQHKAALFVKAGRYQQGEPSVKYRGIFLNDEAPDLSGWVAEKFGTIPPRENPPIPQGVANYGSRFYARIFEVILRLKGNYLWPAMWNNAFNEDDPENPRLANLYGIVMGTSHQEPMLRAQKEWDRRYLHTLGTWNYAVQPDVLAKFWRDGIRRNKHDESIITIGLRGANDTPMAPGGPEANMTLLEKIVDVQRKIIAEEMNPDVAKVPQLWCLYKEVLDFYKAGMRVPDDVTLLWPDDNWGNNRRLPTADERKRSGGAGIYYHFDYHGGPRSYQWINTNPIPKIWEQMSLAKEYGADRIWIVNVGHFKGYELPTEFFLDYAWNTRRWTNATMDEFTRLWAEREFGPDHASEIAGIVSQYTRFNGRRKPELLSPQTYSLVNYREAETVAGDFKALADRAEKLSGLLPADERDAFYELVLFPTKASALVNELYVTAGKNALYAKQERSMTSAMADKTRDLFSADTALMGEFNRTLAGGKWDHFMDQPHLGYTSWQDPPSNSLRAIPLTDLNVPDTASMGVAVEGSEDSWPGAQGVPALPRFDPYGAQQRYVEIYKRGTRPFAFTARPDREWLSVSAAKGTVDSVVRLWVSIDWSKTKDGEDSGAVQVAGTGRTIPVRVSIFNPGRLPSGSPGAFVEGDRYVSIEAEHYSNATRSGSNRWIKIDGYGQTLSGMRSSAGADAPPLRLGTQSPCLQYRMCLSDTGSAVVEGIFGPGLNFLAGRAVQYGVSFDNEQPELVTLIPKEYSAQNGNRDWERTVILNTRSSRTTHRIGKAGYHTLKVWMVDPGVVLEKIVVDLGGVRPSSLGPPESRQIK